ncbi:hypothetical protein JTB14_010586 [Gonioctena quinquepunctata]|nr:hypothetical protein JTB14_010586 [Gonioctena quinquepunctata]
MRHRLVLALQMERSGDSLHHPEYPFPFAEDGTAVMTELEESSGLVDSFSGPRTSSEAEKLQTKMAHVLGRIDWMDPGEEADKQEKKAGLVASAFSLLGRFNHTCDVGGSSSPSWSRVAPPALSQLEARLASISFTANVGAAASSTLSVDPDPALNSFNKMIPPHKWDIQTFTGDSEGTSVTAYFKIVDELRVAKNVPKVVLFDSGMDLFANRANQFYKDCRSRVNNWDELVSEFKVEYLSANHNDALFEELQKSTQHPSESIGVYLAVMASYFNRLGCPVTEEAKLNVITRIVCESLYQKTCPS